MDQLLIPAFSTDPIINCTSLYRISTKSFDGKVVCGKCIDGYIGDIYSTDSVCIAASFANLLNKKCPNDCNGNGTCIFFNTNDGSTVLDCKVQSQACDVKCQCNTGWTGLDCSMSRAELLKLQQIQENILDSIITVAAAESRVQSTQAIVTTIDSTIRILSANTEEMSPKTAQLAEQIIGRTMDNAISANVPVKTAAQFTNVVSNIISSTVSTQNNTRKDTITTLYEKFVDGLGALNSQTGGNTNIAVSTKSLQVLVTSKAQPVNSVGSLAFASDVGTALNHELHLVSYDLINKDKNKNKYNQNIPITLSVTRSTLYESIVSTTDNVTILGQFERITTSNPLRTQLNCNIIMNSSVIIKIQNNANEQYEPILPLVKKVIRYCTPNMTDQVITYNCSYPTNDNSVGISYYPIYGTCIGNKTIIQRCPSRRRIPSCQLTSNMGSCKVLNFTSSYTFCSCLLCAPQSSARQLQMNEIGSVAYQVKGMTEFIFDDYVATMKKAATLDSDAVEKSIILISTFVIVWGIVLGIVLLRYGYSRLPKNEDKTNNKPLSIVPDAVNSNDQVIEVRESPEEVLHKYLLSYMPSIYQQAQYDKTHTWIFNVILRIIRNHSHFSLLLNTKHASKTAATVWLNTLHILTILSANMFMLSVLFNLQYPINDGRCSTFNDNYSCEREKSFYGGQTKCDWHCTLPGDSAS